MTTLLGPKRQRRKPRHTRRPIAVRAIPYSVRKLIERFCLPVETAVEIAVAAGFRLEVEK